MARKMYREAVETYQQALEQEPQAARLHNKLGIAFHHQLDFGRARKNYEKAIKLQKDFSQAVNNLGTVFYAQRRYKKAAQTYQKALKYSPDSASIHSNLGTAHFARGKYKEATKEYLIALQLDPNVFEHRSSVGTLLQDRSVEDRAKYHFFMARAYAQAGILDRALLYLRRSLEEGYGKRKQIAEDAAFEALWENPEFQALIVGEQQAALR
jgi:tetratricopeptide (TPR) repeat protein